MEGARSTGGGRVVLVPLPYQGHLNPMLHLATILHSKGFSITVVSTQFNSPNSSNYPDLNFLSIPDGLSHHEAASGDFMSVIISLNTNCGAALRESLQRMQDEVVCVIYDGLMHYVEPVAKRLKIPSMVLRANNVLNVLTYAVYPRLQQTGDLPIPESKLMELVPEMHPLRYMDLPIHKFYDIEAYLHLVSKVSDIGSSTGTIWNTVACLEQPALAKVGQQYQSPMFTIGPLHKVAKASSSSTLIQEDTSCISWLDNQPKGSVLYVSLGSVANVGEKALAEMAWGLANSEQPFLWVIRPGSVAGSRWIELLPPGFVDMVGGRGCIVKWAPQTRVLEHEAVGGFWSHCGWNSTVESVSEGVPMICMPCFGDQRVNARYVTQVWKIGVVLENDLERGEIEMTVRRLMVGDQGKVMRQRALDLKNEIGTCIREGGSSYNSLCELVDFIKL